MAEHAPVKGNFRGILGGSNGVCLQRGQKMSKRNVPAKQPDPLFDRIVTILEEARGHVVRAVNTNMTLAYWLIGREIVESVQGGEERAEYGKQVIDDLSARLTERYGKGFSVTTLQYFRKFYMAYSDRRPAIPRPMGVESGANERIPFPTRKELAPSQIRHPSGTQSGVGFLAELSWSHYRVLMRVEDRAERDFYEREAAECGWSKAELERQIHTSYYRRILANRGEAGLAAEGRGRLPGTPLPAEAILKSPYVLEFLGLPDTPELRESAVEQAIIDNLQLFLLELGRGFSFVARQKHLRFDDEDFYVDLVFYNFILKCFLLVDLKIGKLTHRDVGQMDGYVRLFEDCFKVPGDNPTIGL
ncbi:MAG TPA: PDDEXK nuclease domain-containing protein, partial [Candidatus Hydrogenedentes bacterium]|nr:PDDEXK nuclease domain-containing protein [Candidatus Hydrogenedentota bacterium]